MNLIKKSCKYEEKDLKKRIMIIFGYYLILFLFDLLLREGEVLKKIGLYGETIVGCVLLYAAVYLFGWFMAKNPLSSQNSLRRLFRILAGALGVCSIIYGIYYFIGAYSKMPFHVSIICMAILNVLELAELKTDSDCENV